MDPWTCLQQRLRLSPWSVEWRIWLPLEIACRCKISLALFLHVLTVYTYSNFSSCFFLFSFSWLSVPSLRLSIAKQGRGMNANGMTGNGNYWISFSCNFEFYRLCTSINLLWKLRLQISNVMMWSEIRFSTFNTECEFTKIKK